MPSKSKAQRTTMLAAAHNPRFAKKMGIPQDVAADYVKADKRLPKKDLARLPKRKGS